MVFTSNSIEVRFDERVLKDKGMDISRLQIESIPTQLSSYSLKILAAKRNRPAVKPINSNKYFRIK